MIIVTPWPPSPPPPPPPVTCELPQSASCQWISVTGCGDLFSSQGRGHQQANMFRTISMEIIIPPSYWPHGWEWCYCSWAEDIWSRLRSPALNISALFLLPVNRYDSSLAKLTVMIQADPLTYLEFPRLWGNEKRTFARPMTVVTTIHMIECLLLTRDRPADCAYCGWVRWQMVGTVSIVFLNIVIDTVTNNTEYSML